MAGANIHISATGIERINKKLTQFIQQGGNLEPAFREIGEYLLESHEERFKLEIGPDGKPWEPLSPETIKRKKGDNRILRDSNTLMDTLRYQISGNGLEFGTNLEYAATHQFGRETDGIPERPFLGLASSPFNDRDELRTILLEHIDD